MIRPITDATFEMFMLEWDFFRECSGLRRYTVEQMDNKFAELIATAIRAGANPETTPKQNKTIDAVIQLVLVEHPRRQAYRVCLGPTDDA